MWLTAAEIAALTNGAVEGNSKVLLTGAEVDSRMVRPGELFVALPGARRDGHHFVVTALETAHAALVRQDATLAPPSPAKAMVRVSDPLVAYHRLASRVRARSSWAVAAITGSVGKTTTKDFLARLLSSRFRVGASEGNRNNTLGLPAQLLSQPDDIQVFVAEAGMNQPGELNQLGVILRPGMLLYTRIAPAHIEFFNGMDGVVAAKAELLAHLQPDGTLVVNADDPLQQSFPDLTTARVLRYGGTAEARLENLEDRGLLGSRFDLVLAEDRAPVTLPLAGAHQAENLLAAAVAASVYGVTAEEIAAKAPELEAAPRRGRVHHLDDGIVLVDDSYNASPVAMERLLGMLAAAPGRRVALLGEMYELGASAVAAHRQVGAAAAAACDLLVAVGDELAQELADAADEAGMDGASVLKVDDAERATEVLRAELRENDVVLVKGSRGVGLDRTVDALVEGNSS